MQLEKPAAAVQPGLVATVITKGAVLEETQAWAGNRTQHKVPARQAGPDWAASRSGYGSSGGGGAGGAESR